MANMLSHRGIIERIYWLPLKAIDFNGVDTKSFLKVFEVLMYMFIFIDFLEVILINNKNFTAVKN